jgi:hypothetical protein
MGYKYEVAIWVRKAYARGDYHYQVIHLSNNVLGLLWALWQNRKNGALRVVIR